MKIEKAPNFILLIFEYIIILKPKRQNFDKVNFMKLKKEDIDLCKLRSEEENKNII